ncbi:Uncharacterised protein [BD1-7 clade bacterium]|uniref:AttH domain-containing protein n=1 Tax=BD1-7 clade bacterium TaxID=2029982 RepID=A0A5S9QX74_9GAMM|nr:Uncharacterised protein [BD1-7 clade bacterium]
MKTYHRPVTAAPDSLIDAGRCKFGTFNTVVEKPDLLAVHRPLGFPAPQWFNYWRLKEWQAFQIDCDDWFFCISVYDTKSLGTAIIMAWHKPSATMRVYQKKVPTFLLKVPCGLNDSVASYTSKDFTIVFGNRLASNQIRITAETHGLAGLPDIHMEWHAELTGEPQLVFQPFGKNRPLYSLKSLMRARGSVTFDGQSNDYDANVILDDHKGFYPFTMQYDWVTGLQQQADGTLSGFNLTDNQVLNPTHFNENCLWHAGKMHPLPPISVSRPGGIMAPWQIQDSDGQVDLTFTPLADVPNLVNLGLFCTRYHGPTGQLTGTITTEATGTVKYQGCFGMGEEKYMRL